jgi:hypothetical protein
MKGMDSEPSVAERSDEPWIIPREYEIGGVRWFSDAARELSRALHPLLAQIPRVGLAEAPPTRTADGASLSPQASPLYRPMVISHEWTVSIEDVVGFKADQFLADLHVMADDMGEQMVRGFLEHVFEVSDQYGNTIDAGGRDFFDVYADAMETIDMSFDDAGRPNLTLILHPDQLDKLKDRQPTAEQEARLNAILERRREEWRASRRRRDLP